MPLFGFLFRHRLYVGLFLVVTATTLIAVGPTVITDYYFPIAWYGYILTLDGLLARRGHKPMSSAPAIFLIMIPLSSVFWWVFEVFNHATHNWEYIGSSAFTGAGFVAYASLCFSTVLLAVWETALCLDSLLSPADRAEDPYCRRPFLLQDAVDGYAASKPGRRWSLSFGTALWLAFIFGIACIILPVLFPHYAFGLIWGSLFFLLDPINYWLGRSSLLAEMWSGKFRTAFTFAGAGLVCGFFWEGWNYWAPIKWIYHVPFVSQFHLFEMPLPGYLGYLPFGLELYAMTVFTVPFILSLVRRRSSARTPGVLSSPATVPESL